MHKERAHRIWNRRMNRRDTLWLLSTTTAGTLASTSLTGCAVNPVTGEKQLMLMSESQEIALDQSQSPHQFSADYGAVQDDEVNDYITKVGDELASRSHRPKMPYNYRGVNAPHVNAYTFPGGSMAITRGILLGMENEAELAGLLGHELGHVNARHSAERMTKGMLTQVALAGASMYAGSQDPALGKLTQMLGGFASSALLAHYSRDNERQADALGMEYMTRPGYNPSGMTDLMDLLVTSSKHKPSALQVMFSTHPMGAERLESARLAIDNKYASFQDAPINRERYMDTLARLRRQKPTVDALQDASEEMRGKNFDGAERDIRTALNHLPTDYAALVMMSKVQLAQGRKQEALRFAEDAKRVYPEEAQALQVASISNLSMKRYSRAQEDIQRYEALLPGNPGTAFLSGIAYEGMNDKKRASNAYTAYLRRVKKGDQAQYAYKRLVNWGVIKPPQKQQQQRRP
ncbi:MAG: M48 family metalloprotease [Magnetococcales bacterium]|nr:M48 family metalloprotease [Magnetococcales bacterium]